MSSTPASIHTWNTPGSNIITVPQNSYLDSFSLCRKYTAMVLLEYRKLKASRCYQTSNGSIWTKLLNSTAQSRPESKQRRSNRQGSNPSGHLLVGNRCPAARSGSGGRAWPLRCCVINKAPERPAQGRCFDWQGSEFHADA